MDDDDNANLLLRVLKGRLEDTFTRFCADIPQILRSMPRSGDDRDGADDGPDFVRALLEWVAGTSPRSQASRYLLMWYAKTVAEKGAHRVPDCQVVAELIRARLSRAELVEVDQALASGWDALRNAGSLKTLAARQRKLFLTTLTPAERSRFARYLAAVLPPVALIAGTAATADAAAASSGAAGSGAVSSASGSGIATWTGSAVLVVGLPLVAALGWYAVRGRATPPPRSLAHTAPMAGRAGQGAAMGGGAVVVVTPVTVAALAPEPTPGEGGLAADQHPAFRWTRQVSGVESALVGVASSGSLTVVVGQDGIILSSTDGVVWKAALLSLSHDFLGVAYGHGVFVAVGSSKRGTHGGQLIATSTDGATWAEQGQPDHMALVDVAFGNGAFVAVGVGGALLRSTDGERWRTVDSGTATQLNGVSYVGDRFVVVGYGGTWLTSPDGVAWATQLQKVDLGFGRAVFGNGVYLSFATLYPDGRPHQAKVWRSSDLATWTAQDVTGCEGLVRGGFAEGRFVIAGSGIRSTVDGVEWTTEEPPSAAFTSANDAAWTGSSWIVVGNQGVIFTSTAR